MALGNPQRIKALDITRKTLIPYCRKVYEVDPMLCPAGGDTMKVIAFLTDFSVVDHLINHLKLTFVAERPPAPRVAYQELLLAVETSAKHCS